MFRQLDRVESPALGRPIHLWRFGHYGVPLLVFPSASGVAHEWEAGGLIDTLSGMIEAGRIKLYCTESNVGESWTEGDGHPAERIRRHLAFERYVMDELVPFIRQDCRTEGIRIAVAGASLGAFYAAKFALKHPETFFWALCLSGRYDATWMTGGFSNDDIYFNNPAAFVRGLEGEALARVRERTQLTLVCGQGAFEGSNIDATRQFAAALD
jgi:esterase/lipase superfamily enzyme